MRYKQALDYLNSFINYEKINNYDYKRAFRLERMSYLLENLGNPHKSFRVIHVAGTKGKGSTCAIIYSILKEAGFKVGLYTSPHLFDFRERIRVAHNKIPQKDLPDGEAGPFLEWKETWLTENDLIEFTKRLKATVEKLKHKEQFSFFEIYTALAFLYFKEKGVDFAVLEVGIGGRLDATNVVEPLVSVITDISLEHTEKLGKTIGKIAGEKAGIIKENSIVISSYQKDGAGSCIRRIARQKNAKLFEINRQIFFEDISLGRANSLFNLRSLFTEYPHLDLNLIGRHQLVNAALAVSACEALRFYDIFIGQDAVRRGLKNVFWPGRLHIISAQPLIILDGAQNVASAQALRDSVKRLFKFDKLILVLGISKDKDIYGIVKRLNKITSDVIITKADNPRAAEPKFIRKFFSKRKNVRLTKNVVEGLNLAKSIAGENDLILVTGSLFVVGEALELQIRDERWEMRVNG